MDWIIRGRKELSCSYMEAGAAFLGEDILACIQGGDKPHIGCTVQSVPRPSLTGNGTISATSSVLNLTGHKDEALCRRLAEKLCRETGRVVVCTGGFHIDNMKPEQIDEVVKALDLSLIHIWDDIKGDIKGGRIFLVMTQRTRYNGVIRM